LHPGWFGSVMGTGILALALLKNPGEAAVLATPLHDLGVALAVVAVALAAVFTVASLARWVAHPDAALADLRHPVAGPLFGLFPGGLAVVAVLLTTAGRSFLPEGAVLPLVAASGLAAASLGLVVAVVFTYLLFTGETDARLVNGGWLIPPVINIIVPLALLPLMPHVGAGTARLLVAVSWAYFGVGFFLFVLVLSMIHDRLVLHPLPPAALAPSLWILLGPVGAGSLSLLGLGQASGSFFREAAPALAAFALVAVTALWGFGIWALAAAASLLVRYLRQGPLPYSLGWWGFTFPVGAYAVATLSLARAWQSSALEYAGVALVVLLAVFWAVVAVRTVAGLATGEVWRR
jgi:C4-dicarboxylate transporter/malic acid transport protein